MRQLSSITAKQEGREGHRKVEGRRKVGERALNVTKLLDATASWRKSEKDEDNKCTLCVDPAN